jgi:FAD/FMN-containing dehydrogenase
MMVTHAAARSIALATEAMTDPSTLRAGPEGAVLVEFASSSRHLDLDELMEAVLAEVIEVGWIEDAFLAQSGSQRTAMWRLRETIPEGEKRRNGSVKHDISVPLSSIQRFLDLAGSQVRSYDADLQLSVYGHVGDGNLHYNVLVPAGVDRIEFTKRIESSLSLQLYDTAAALGGTFSAEHGVGRFKRHLLERYGDVGRIAAMRRIKTAFDPADIMNAGAIVCPLGEKSVGDAFQALGLRPKHLDQPNRLVHKERATPKEWLKLGRKRSLGTVKSRSGRDLFDREHGRQRLSAAGLEGSHLRWTLSPARR